MKVVDIHALFLSWKKSQLIDDEILISHNSMCMFVFILYIYNIIYIHIICVPIYYIVLMFM